MAFDTMKRRLSIGKSPVPEAKSEAKPPNQIQFHIIHAGGLKGDANKRYVVALKSAPIVDKRETAPKKATELTIFDEKLLRVHLHDNEEFHFVVKIPRLGLAKVVAVTDAFTIPAIRKLKGPGAEAFSHDTHTDLELRDPKSCAQVGNLRIIMREFVRGDVNLEITHINTVAYSNANRENCYDALLKLQNKLLHLLTLMPDNPLLNINFAALKAALKFVDDPANIRIKTSISELLFAMNSCLQVFQHVTTRTFDKFDQKTSFLHTVLMGSVRALQRLEYYFMSPPGDPFEEDKREVTLLHYIEFFEKSLKYLRGVSGIDQPKLPSAPKARAPINVNDPLNEKRLRRLEAIKIDFPQHNSETRIDDSDEVVWLISEWLLSKSFTPNKAVLGVLGRQDWGKTQLMSNLLQSFNELHFLGGYFSFDNKRHVKQDNIERHPIQSFPYTLAHQLSVAVPSTFEAIERVTLKAPPARLKDKIFEFLLKPLVPLQEYRDRGEDGKLPLRVDPVLFILDDVDRLNAEDLELLLTSLNSFKAEEVPPYVKFLLLGRPTEALRNCHDRFPMSMFVHEIVPTVSYVDRPKVPRSPLIFDSEKRRRNSQGHSRSDSGSSSSVGSRLESSDYFGNALDKKRFSSESERSEVVFVDEVPSTKRVSFRLGAQMGQSTSGASASK